MSVVVLSGNLASDMVYKTITVRSVNILPCWFPKADQ